MDSRLVNAPMLPYMLDAHIGSPTSLLTCPSLRLSLPPYQPLPFAYQTPTAPPPPSRQPWPRSDPLPAAPPSLPPEACFFPPSPTRIEGCAFCTLLGHRLRECPTIREYLASGKALVINDRLYLANGQAIPNDGTGRGLKSSIDSWLAAQSASSTPPQTTSNSTRDTPPHIALNSSPRNNSSAHIEEVTETHMYQVSETVSLESDNESDEVANDIFQVFGYRKEETRGQRS